MGTSFQEVYAAFLARITADEWTLEEDLAIVERDWQELLKMAIGRFKYPRVSLDFEEVEKEIDGKVIKEYQFVDTLTNDEIQVLAIIMRYEWVSRCVASWENIRQLYADRDFSQANHLDKLIKYEARLADTVDSALDDYDRSRNKRPALLFKKLAGKKNAKLY